MKRQQMQSLEMLSPLFSLHIPFKPSRDYVKLSIILSLITLGLLYQLHYTGYELLFAALCLSYPLIKIFHQQRPHLSIEAIFFRNSNWWLMDNNGQETCYTQLSIRVDTGLFMLVVLLNGKRRKQMLIFHDQLTTDSRRMLNIIAKLT